MKAEDLTFGIEIETVAPDSAVLNHGLVIGLSGSGKGDQVMNEREKRATEAAYDRYATGWVGTKREEPEPERIGSPFPRFDDAAPPRKRKPLFKCLECGRKFYTVAAAERAAFGNDGCPGCGGSDIDGV